MLDKENKFNWGRKDCAGASQHKPPEIIMSGFNTHYLGVL